MVIKDLPLLFSDDIAAFIQEVRGYAKQILFKEVQLIVRKDRFLIKRFSYPLHFVAFEHPNKLGFFSSAFYEIGINKALMFAKDITTILNVIRHELAHYLTYIEYGSLVDPHGKEYISICKRYGWGKEVSLATATLSKTDFKLDEKKPSQILSKIEKLLSLSSSNSIYESTQATLKANKLLFKYNLENVSLKEELVLKRILSTKRFTTKLQAISEVLRTFFVYPVLNHSKEGVYLEISGKKINIEIAEYVAYFLDNKMEELWIQFQKERKLKGLTAKNSFFRGLAKGYLEKSSEDKGELENQNALLVIEKQLDIHVKLIYPNLKSSRVSYKTCNQASLAGIQAGKNLTIQKGIKSNFTSQKVVLING